MSKFKRKQSSKKKFLHFFKSKELIFAVIGAILTIGTNYVNNLLTPKDEQAEKLNKLITVQTNQLKNQAISFKEGFEQLSKALLDDNKSNSSVDQIMKKLSSDANLLTKLSMDVYDKAKESTSLIDYYKKRTNIPKGSDEVWVLGVNGSAEYLDSKNHVAVIKDANNDGSNVRVNLNGKKHYWTNGDKRTYTSDKNVECRLTYLGKRSEYYVFSKECN